jgi:hypothetical protein
VKTIASLILFLVLLTPGLREALNQITGTEILGGLMELHSGFNADIQALGKKDGAYLKIEIKWKNGQLNQIEYIQLGSET